ncbi:NAD-dependent succinate-semialdehyde dehydrogenase [Sinorhizobium meliloti]|uniref:NAD-dependent succinate-semialdehyde dehydrogenase n=1 Tax=Rhizobium meliloti TaxID=382 RepID=UPI000D1F82AB|nr:NAD-dependent succinate-semialdehyde dehydrogenase [Sinorhizobium meliloti]RMI15837.1 NAD-dependent succinate-semialdehyde dehydrogenase [Sinorhizobium meliloti]RVH98434.1 NAD-dependent succinate-semialdehyde dehydrogenase [Sinorhizobium meliloti]RVK87216.1 NAD-dependent succinate-semialdehyde dehydrogenase [Sinorhizobium meliloti]RVL23516.1 NAD-dependent succinate-semialdehyde dehydrogenase [Sinorhizobium meliloti]RVP38391.1 NAD-dependent succinate-semialdehyde dehydrogenase [Sinorhizobium
MAIFRDLKLRKPELLRDRAFVAGMWVEAPSANRITVTDPFDGSAIADLPSLGLDAVRLAIDIAHESQKAWAARPARERAVILKRWYELILENSDDLAIILTREQGKPLSEAKGEILANANYIEWFAEEAKRTDGDIIAAPVSSQRLMVLKQPVGTCAAITPWNFPNGMITRKAGAAFAAGCSMVLKPASQTPLSALALAFLGQQAGIPDGLFSVVTGAAKAIGEEFATNPKIAKISFTGSTQVGRWLMERGAGQIKRLSLELGGNAPFIVFDDADVGVAVEGAIASKFRNAGQTCVCANRFYVQEGILARFSSALSKRVAQLKLGNGSDPETSQGPLIDERAVAKIEEHIEDAISKGAIVIAGGRRSELGGNFFEPTVMTGVTQEMKVAKEETFAPLAPLIAFHTESDVIAMANDTEYGLASYFYTRDYARIWRMAEALEAGMVGVNTGLIGSEAAPFGGVKQSGLGREGSKYGITEYLEIKYVCVAGIGAAA